MVHRATSIFAALLGAAILAQFPAFYGDYLQRLGGRLDQARVQIERLDRAAQAENMTREAYVAVFLTNAQSPVRRQGQVMQAEFEDFDRLRAAQAALHEAPVASRPWRLAHHMEAGLARAALGDFTPGLPLSLEGLLYAAMGALAGLGLLGGARRGRRLLRRARKRAAA